MDDIDEQDRRRKISGQAKAKKSKRKAERAQEGKTSIAESAELYASLGSTVEEISAKLGEPAYIEEVPFWPLPNEEAAIVFTKLHPEDEASHAYRIGHAGIFRFPVGWCQYDAENKTFILLSGQDRDDLRQELRQGLVEHWGENGEKRRIEVEQPEAEKTAGFAELVPLRTYADFEAKFGKADRTNKVDGVPFWIDGDDAALPGARGEGGQRVPKGGYGRVKGAWYQFDGEKFTRAEDERSQRLEKNYQRNRSTERVDAPSKPEQPERSERPKQRESAAVDRASGTFNDSFAPKERGSLAKAYRVAIQDLSGTDLTKFRTSIEQRFSTEVAPALLRAILDQTQADVEKNRVIPRRRANA
jgi:hypothetical protein